MQPDCLDVIQSEGIGVPSDIVLLASVDHGYCLALEQLAVECYTVKLVKQRHVRHKTSACPVPPMKGLTEFLGLLLL